MYDSEPLCLLKFTKAGTGVRVERGVVVGRGVNREFRVPSGFYLLKLEHSNLLSSVSRRSSLPTAGDLTVTSCVTALVTVGSPCSARDRLYNIYSGVVVVL